MTIYKLDPLTDPRWAAFVAGHPQSSIFHTAGWLRALRLTYGYRPLAFTTSDAGPLTNALVFCEVQSWLTGRRLISLPFSDHCEPLGSSDDVSEILNHLERSRRSQRWKYIELRPAQQVTPNAAHSGFSSSEHFSFHAIDLRPGLDAVFGHFHSSSIRGKIRRAERQNFVYESGTSDDLLHRFGSLLMLTRRRQKLPPQPASWFRNLVHSLGPSATIHLVSQSSVPVASILTLTHNKTMVYKYSCSDARFNSLGGVPLLIWKAIQQAVPAGIQTFDLGRSAPEDPGLIAFKERLGASAYSLTYHRSPAPGIASSAVPASSSAFARRAISHLPDPLFAGVGQLLYRHMA
jgi:hypothetical protein